MGLAGQLDPVRPRLEGRPTYVFDVMGGHILEHVVFDWNRDSHREGFLIQPPCWKSEAGMDDATLFGRRPGTGFGAS